VVSRLHLLLTTVLLSACAGDKAEDTATITELDGVTTRRWSGSSDADGLHEVRVDVASGEDALLVCGQTGESSRWMSVEKITDPDGFTAMKWQDWYDTPEVLTGAIFPSGQDTCLNWPVRDEDGPLSSGVWSVWLAATNDRNQYASGTTIDVVAQSRQSPGGAGVLRIALAYGGDLSEDAELVTAVDAAVARWADIWSAEAGVEIEVEAVNVDMGADLPDLLLGGDEWAAASALTDDGDMLVVIGETIDGSTALYGLSGGVPGGLASAPRAAVAISWLANAGQNGVFDEDEVQLLGDTLAHEAGHFAGLVHPVESSWDQWDALSDTSECTRRVDCEDDLADNNMFPYPLCSRSACEPQEVLTEEQAAVLRQYTGVH
jgi:hypothetical protein